MNNEKKLIDVKIDLSTKKVIDEEYSPSEEYLRALCPCSREGF